MSEYTFLVRCNIERESGLHASRDDITEEVTELLNNAIEGEQISGLGARSDSEYVIDQTDIWILQKKEEKEVWAAHDEMVAADYPGDVALRAELRAAIRARSEAERKLRDATDRIAAFEREKASEATRVYQRDPGKSISESVNTYLQDGPHDSVVFQFGKRWDEAFDVRLTSDGDLEIRQQNGSLSITPTGGNTIRLEARDHFGRKISDRE